MSIFTYEKLYKAYLDCRKNKRSTTNALKFELNLTQNLADLLYELKSRTYFPGRSICFVVSKPTPREIFAADFRDRIVHHLLVREILAESDKRFFWNSFACRKGKGTHKAVAALKKYMKIAGRNGREKIYFLQLDIKSFFVSIKHSVLHSIFRDFIFKLERDEEWKQEMLWLGSVIIFHRPQENCEIRGNKTLLGLIPSHKSLLHVSIGYGLPIGNYSSQFFANMYLNELDYFIKQKLKMKYYVRYVDDLIILGKDKSKLESLIGVVDVFLRKNLEARLNLNKTKLKNAKSGIDFLGYFIKPDYTLVRRRVVRNCKEKICRAPVFNVSETVSLKLFLSQVNSYLGHFIQASSHGLRSKTVLNAVGHAPGLFEFDDSFNSIILKPLQ